MKIARIKWLDSIGWSGTWASEDQVEGFVHDTPQSVETVGFLHYEDETKIVLCMSYHDSNRHSLFTIPKGAILDFVYLSGELTEFHRCEFHRQGATGPGGTCGKPAWYRLVGTELWYCNECLDTEKSQIESA